MELQTIQIHYCTDVGYFCDPYSPGAEAMKNPDYSQYPQRKDSGLYPSQPVVERKFKYPTQRNAAVEVRVYYNASVRRTLGPPSVSAGRTQ